MTIQLNLSTGKKIELTEVEFQELKESLKNIRDNVWSINTYPSGTGYPPNNVYYRTGDFILSSSLS